MFDISAEWHLPRTCFQTKKTNSTKWLQQVVIFFLDGDFILLWQVDVCHCAVWHLPRTWFQTKRPSSTDPFQLVTLSPIWLQQVFDSFFRLLWRGTHLGEVGDLCKLHNNFVKFGMIGHFAPYRLVIWRSHGRCCESWRWMHIPFQHAPTPGHSYYPQGIEVLKSNW